MILAGLLIILLLAAASDTPLRRMLARFGARLKTLLPKTVGGRVALAFAAIVVTIALFQVLKTEALGLAAPMAPELAAWFALIDVGTVMDVFAVAVLAALTVRLRAVVQAARALVTQVVRLWRQGRRGRRRPARKPSGRKADDGEPWSPVPAFA